MVSVILRATVAMLVACVGGAAGVALGRMASNRLNLLVAIAAGALLAVTLFDVLPDARAALSWPAFLAAVGSGYALFWAVGRYVHPICPACAFTPSDEPAEVSTMALPLLIALSLHSTMDGIAVVVSDRLTGHAELPVLLALSLHKLPEGLALVLLLLGMGTTRWKALLWTILVQASTELGGLVGVFTLSRLSPLLLSLIFAHVGGNFLYLIGNVCGLNSSGSRHTASRSLLVGGGLSFLLAAGLIWVSQHFAH